MSRLLYLHGFMARADYAGGTKDVIAEMNLADEIVAFNAPFAVDEGGFKWFTLPEENLERDMAAELKESVDYILEKIKGEKIDIIFGSSQGGFMALYLTLNNFIRPKKTIAAVPFYLPDLIDDDMNKETPILWMAGGLDDRIPANVGTTWKNLQVAGANLDYKIDPLSGHRANTWTDGFKNTIIKWCKGK